MSGAEQRIHRRNSLSLDAQLTTDKSTQSVIIESSFNSELAINHFNDLITSAFNHDTLFESPIDDVSYSQQQLFFTPKNSSLEEM